MIPGPGGKKVVSLPVQVREKTEKGWRIFSSEHWPFDPRFRKFLFIYRSPRTKQLRFHGVSDRMDLDRGDESVSGE